MGQNQQYSVFIVDDQVESIKLINSVLKSEFKTMFAKDSLSAIKMIEENMPDLILLDIQMPEIDGYALCKQIKKNSLISDIPVIFVTANTDIGYEKKGFETGAVDFITKPMNPDILKARVRTHIKLKEAIIEANQANQAKSQFLASMSHEIRTPLNAILGMTELSLQQDLNEDIKENLNVVMYSAKHLKDVINDILDIAKIEAGKIEIDCVDFDFVALIQSILSTFNVQIKQKSLYLKFEKDETTPRYVKGDPIRLKQIIVNLVGNAIKFTQEGGIIVKIAGKKDLNTIHYTLSVADTGIGISQDKLNSIFNSFSQADSSTTRKYGGTGLGLYISKQLIELMGGTISVKSTPGKGSIFYLIFTLEMGNESVINDKQKILESKSRKKQIIEKDILVVDDISTNRKVAEKILNDFGYKPFMATSAKEAFQMLKTMSFDLILMDIEMPEMDGLEATRLIRSGKFGHEVAKIPVVAMTAHALTKYEQKCIEAGMNDFITKPISFNKLKEKLKKKYATKTIQISKRIENKESEKKFLQVLNTEKAISSLEGDEKFYKKILLDVIELIPDWLEKIKKGLEERNFTDIQFHSHALKNNAGIIKAEYLYEICINIEINAKNKSYDNLFKLFIDLEKEIKRVIEIAEPIITPIKNTSSKNKK